MCVRVFSVGFGPGLDSMSPARSRRSASHVAGTHGWLPQKTGRPGLRRGGVGGYNLHSVPPTVVHQPRAGCIRLVLGAVVICGVVDPYIMLWLLLKSPITNCLKECKTTSGSSIVTITST